MLCYGCCIGPKKHFEELALPALSSIMEASDRLLTVRDAVSITSAYNTLIDQARTMPDVEALVLFHDDVVLDDRNFAPRVRRLLRDRTVGVIGVVGASRLCSMSFWDGGITKGRVWDGARYLQFGPPRGDVDAVDGLLMVLSPAAFNGVRFDETTFTGFHGYDVDYCLSCREAGLRVVVEPFYLYHRSTGEMSSSSYAAAQAAFNQKWGKALLRPSPLAGLLPDPVQRSEVRQTTADVRVAVRQGLERARANAGISLQRAGRKVRRRLNIGEVTGTKIHIARNETGQGSDRLGTSLKACLLCGRPMQATTGDMPLISCEECDIFASWPPPHIDESGSQIFDLSYSGERARRRKQWTYEARQRLAWIETWVPDGILLEVGSATGEFVREATEVGYEAIGVEPSNWASEVARRTGADVLSGRLDDWTAEYAGFTVDAIVMFHVLEHLEDPAELLVQGRSILAESGKIFIEVPNASSRAAKLLDPSWVGWQLPFHQWHYTPSSLRDLLERVGLEILELREVTARIYMDRTSWRRSRAESWAAGHNRPNLDYLRVVAQAL